MAPDFSIVVPNYNHGHLLKRCITSATSQEGVDLEVVVVDNDSTDDSVDRIEALMREDARIRLLRNTVNLGHIYSINRGIDNAQGSYLVVLCADDLLLPGALRRVKSVMDRLPNVTLAYGRASTDLNEARSTVPQSEDYEIVDGWSWVTECARRGKTPTYSPEVVVRTSAQRAAGPYSEDLLISTDMLAFLLVAAQGDVCRFQALHGIFDSGPSSFTATTEYLGHLREQRDAFEAFYRHPLAAPGSARVDVHRRRLGWLGARLAQQSLVSRDTVTARQALRYAASVLSGKQGENPRWTDYAGMTRLGSEALSATRSNVSGRRRARRARRQPA